MSRRARLTRRGIVTALLTLAVLVWCGGWAVATYGAPAAAHAWTALNPDERGAVVLGLGAFAVAVWGAVAARRDGVL